MKLDHVPVEIVLPTVGPRRDELVIKWEENLDLMTDMPDHFLSDVPDCSSQYLSRWYSNRIMCDLLQHDRVGWEELKQELINAHNYLSVTLLLKAYLVVHDMSKPAESTWSQ